MKSIVAIPGVIGGLSGILIGCVELLSFIVSAASSHMPRSWIEGSIISPEIGAGIFILLGIFGAVSALLYPTKKVNSGWIIILCGLLGFPVGYASGSYASMGWVSWIFPGTLLVAAGLISLAGPDRIKSSLPMLSSENSRSRSLGSALYSVLFIAILIMIMSGLLYLGSAPDTSPQGMATQDQRDLEGAGVTQSMGLYKMNPCQFTMKYLLAINQTTGRGMRRAQLFQDSGDMMRRSSAMIEHWRSNLI
jgi:hypothetical protein